MESEESIDESESYKAGYQEVAPYEYSFYVTLGVTLYFVFVFSRFSRGIS